MKIVGIDLNLEFKGICRYLTKHMRIIFSFQIKQTKESTWASLK
jgi:hypothetical protein